MYAQVFRGGALPLLLSSRHLPLGQAGAGLLPCHATSLNIFFFLQVPLEASEECAVCLQEYDNSHEGLPRFLSCGHTFCTTCIHHMKDSCLGTDGLTCPLCRKRHMCNGKMPPVNPALREHLNRAPERCLEAILETCTPRPSLRAHRPGVRQERPTISSTTRSLSESLSEVVLILVWLRWR